MCQSLNQQGSGQKQVNVNTLQSSFQITSRISKSNQAPLSAVPKMEDSGQ
ncbi:hypothetical protein [Vibrio cyclitrophicus]|nr:hypothetical protein [Vibrio cyclitrophicus]